MGLVHHSDRGSQFCRSNTPYGWPRRALRPRRAALATVATSPWPRRSMASSRPKSSIAAALGAASRLRNTQLLNGSPGSTIGVSSIPSEPSRMLKSGANPGGGLGPTGKAPVYLWQRLPMCRILGRRGTETLFHGAALQRSQDQGRSAAQVDQEARRPSPARLRRHSNLTNRS